MFFYNRSDLLQIYFVFQPIQEICTNLAIREYRVSPFFSLFLSFHHVWILYAKENEWIENFDGSCIIFFHKLYIKNMMHVWKILNIFNVNNRMNKEKYILGKKAATAAKNSII
jgi:hypothetical protein